MNNEELQKYALTFVEHLQKRYKCDLTNPRTIKDKLNWLKVYDCTPLKTKCADKILLRDYVNSKIVGIPMIPIIKTYSNADEIDFDSLPNACVIKCNHGSGYNIMYEKGKSNEQDVIKKLNEWLNTDYSNEHNQVELHYRNIERKILVEEKINIIKDYKFWCFNGVPKFFVSVIKSHFMNYYDMKGNKLNIARCGHPNFYEEIGLPKSILEQLKYYATVLSNDFKFVRVDFAKSFDDVYYLTELTFIPGSGLVRHKNKNIDYMIGDMLTL